MVDYVCIFDEDTPLEAILKIRPDVLVKGADWADNIVGSKEVESWGGKVVALPLGGRSVHDGHHRARSALEVQWNSRKANS